MDKLFLNHFFWCIKHGQVFLQHQVTGLSRRGWDGMRGAAVSIPAAMTLHQEAGTVFLVLVWRAGPKRRESRGEAPRVVSALSDTPISCTCSYFCLHMGLFAHSQEQRAKCSKAAPRPSRASFLHIPQHLPTSPEKKVTPKSPSRKGTVAGRWVFH